MQATTRGCCHKTQPAVAVSAVLVAVVALAAVATVMAVLCHGCLD